jgi:ABC-type methionine transport system ATPase subunit
VLQEDKKMIILSEDSRVDLRKKSLRIRLRIPKKFQGNPVIFQLVSKYELQVNILRAILGANGEGDGWFDLLIEGKQEQIDNAFVYLSELDIEIWHENNLEIDGW